jgi:hypothetical protein
VACSARWWVRSLRILCFCCLTAALISVVLLSGRRPTPVHRNGLISAPLLTAAVVLPNDLQVMGSSPGARTILTREVCQRPLRALEPPGMGMLADVVRQVARPPCYGRWAASRLLSGAAGAVIPRLRSLVARLALARFALQQEHGLPAGTIRGRRSHGPS